jgi:regulator-associated protein of mTOR
MQADLMKDKGYTYFIKYLEAHDSAISGNSRAQAAFVLAVVCDSNVRGQGLCMLAGLVGVLCNRLMAAAIALDEGRDLLLTRWLCLSLGRLIEDLPEVRNRRPLSH